MRAWVVALVSSSAVAASMASIVGCLKKPTFQCATADECGAGGLCEADGFCSFVDGECASGRRYGTHSGPNAGQCVGEIGPPPDGPPPDMEPDVLPPDARECFGGAGAYAVCIDGSPMGAVTLAGTVDTVGDVRCLATQPTEWMTAGQPDSCFIVGDSITVTGAVDVTGTRPLVLIAATIQIDALIDVSSSRATGAGPGGNSALCAAFVADATDDTPVAAGGAGGSFVTIGGAGGRADNDNGIPGGVPAPADSAAPTILRGGCAGQVGGDATGAGGLGGAGGGTIFLAATAINFGANGRINASGAGGAGSNAGAGGGGGGSGGMIVMIADAIVATGAEILANGGGGAAGSDTGGGAAQDGNEPNPGTPGTQANGGQNPGGNGGDGFARGGAGDQVADPGGSGNNDAGGGGGGGGGYIQSNVALTGATVSPAATVVP